MKPLRILTHGASDSLNDLVSRLRELEVHDIKKIKRSGSTYRGNPEHLVFNWGSSSYSAIDTSRCRIFNDPSAVAIAVNKLRTFETLSASDMEGNLPQWTTDIQVAREYSRSGTIVYCRQTLTGSQGNGIVVAHNEEELVPAPLYTMQTPIRREVRLHIFNGTMISFAQKKRVSSERREEEGISLSSEVRNLSNGWCFARQGVTIPEDAEQVAIRAVAALGLDFGAVDMGISQGVPKIFEINTAPGLEGTTLEAYANAIWTLLEN